MPSAIFQTPANEKNWRSVSFSFMTKTSYSNNCKNRLLIKKLLPDKKRTKSQTIKNNSFFQKIDYSSIKKFKNTDELNEIFLTKFASSSHNDNINNRKESSISKNENKLFKDVENENLKINIEEKSQIEINGMNNPICKKRIILNSASLSKRTSNYSSVKSSPKMNRRVKPFQLIANEKVNNDNLRNEDNLHDFKLIQKNCTMVQDELKNHSSFEEMSKNLNNLSKKLDFFLNEQNLNFKKLQAYEKKDDFLRANNYQLTECEMNTIIREFQKNDDERDLDLIDNILKRLKFFLKFPTILRLKLIKIAKLVYYPSNFNLFKEGEAGEHMYIIIKGAIDVYKKIKESYSNKFNDILVSALYDGDHFGELAMLGKGRNKHLSHLDVMGSVECMKDIYRIEKEDAIKKKLEQKKDLIRKLEEIELIKSSAKRFLTLEEEAFLKEYDAKKKKKLINEIKSADIKMGLAISRRLASVKISESSYLLSINGENYRDILFNVIKEELESKIQILLYLPFFQKYEPYGLVPIANYLSHVKFKLGEVILGEGDDIDSFFLIYKGYCKVVKIIRNDGIAANAEQLLSMRDKRVYENQKMIENSKDNSYKAFIEYKKLGVGDFFGTRALLGRRFQHLGQSKNVFINLDTERPEPAKLSIADSKEAEIFKFESKYLCMIPEILKNTFVNGLISFREFDDVDVSLDRSTHNNWIQYKMEKKKETLDYVLNCKKRNLSDWLRK